IGNVTARSPESNVGCSPCLCQGFQLSKREKALRGLVGIHRFQTDSQVVYGREVWNLHSLGCLFRSGVRGTQRATSESVCGMVLAFTNRREAERCDQGGGLHDVGLPQARLRSRFPLFQFRSEVSSRVVPAGRLGGPIREIGREVRSTYFEASRRLYSLEERAGEPLLGAEMERCRYRAEARRVARFDGSGQA